MRMALRWLARAVDRGRDEPRLGVMDFDYALFRIV